METNTAFRRHLQNELVRRANKNPSFSIRAFARQLRVEPSSLAQILAGKRALSDKMCLRLSEALGLSPAKVKSLMKREIPGATALTSFKTLSEDAFRVIADWHYYAILELTRIDTFKGDIKWIARVLDISTAEASTAIERLKRLGYLKIEANGRWVDALSSAVNLGNEKTAPAFREHQKQLLSKASAALENVAYEERVQSSMMLVGSKERVAEAKRRILTFIEELDEYMKTGETKDEVYALSVSLFPLSQTREKNSKESEVPKESAKPKKTRTIPSNTRSSS